MTAFSRPVKIFGVPLSVHTRKVILASRIKAIPHDVTAVIPVIPGNPPENWRSLSPTGLIPAIDDNGFVLADSTAILLYLERKVPEPSLLPAEIEHYARALFIDAWASDALFRKVVQPIFYNQIVRPGIHKQPRDQTAIDVALRTSAPEAFAYLESLAPEAFLVGGRLTVADLAVTSNLVMFHYLGHRIEPTSFPRLAAYFRRQLDSSILRTAVQAEMPFAENLGLDRAFLV